MVSSTILARRQSEQEGHQLFPCSVRFFGQRSSQKSQSSWTIIMMVEQQNIAASCLPVNQQHTTETTTWVDAGGDFLLLQNVAIGGASAFFSLLSPVNHVTRLVCRKRAWPKTVGFGRFWFYKAWRIWREVRWVLMYGLCRFSVNVDAIKLQNSQHLSPNFEI